MAAALEVQDQSNDTQEQLKKSQGKRKITIELTPKKTSRQVTLSKRRGGLFKKASELWALCGAEVAIVAFSGAGKLFSFGHPSAHSVILLYLNSSSSSSDDDDERKDVITHIRAEEMKKSMPSSSNTGGGFWWDEPIDEHLGLVELERLRAALGGLRNRVPSKLHQINSNSSFGCHDFNLNNTAVVDDGQITDFAYMGRSNIFQPAYDFSCMDYPVHHGMAWHGFDQHLSQ